MPLILSAVTVSRHARSFVRNLPLRDSLGGVMQHGPFRGELLKPEPEIRGTLKGQITAWYYVPPRITRIR